MPILTKIRQRLKRKRELTPQKEVETYERISNIEVYWDYGEVALFRAYMEIPDVLLEHVESVKIGNVESMTCPSPGLKFGGATFETPTTLYFDTDRRILYTKKFRPE